MTNAVRRYGSPPPKSPTGRRVRPHGKPDRQGVRPVLDYDLSTLAGVANSNVTIAWTGPQLQAVTGAATAMLVSANNPVVEQRGGEAVGGLYVWDAFTALVALPNDFVTSWTADAGVTRTNNLAVAPDGTVTAARVRDNSSIASQMLSRAQATAPWVARVWVRAVAGDAPGVAPIFAADTSGTLFTSLGLSTTWHEVIWKGATSTHLAIIFDLATQGAIELWGLQKTSSNNQARRHTLPRATSNAAVGMCTVQVPAGDLPKLVDSNGHYDFELQFKPAASITENVASLQDNMGEVYITTTAGSIYLRWSRAVAGQTEGLSMWLAVNGVDVADTGRPVTSVVRGNVGWLEDTIQACRVYVTPTSVQFRWRSGCCLADDTTKTGLSLTLGTPTGCYLGSQNTVANSSLKARLLRFRAWHDHSEMAMAEPASMLLLGDSTMAYISNNVGVGPCVGTETDALAGKRIYSLAAGGDTLSGQLAKLNASPYKTNPTLAAQVKSAFVQLPINDINSSTPSVDVAQMSAASQTLIDTLAAAFPGIKIFWLQPLPADAVLDATDQQQWIDLISCLSGIAAGGGVAITGLTEFITSASNAMNSNGAVGPAGTNTMNGTYNSGDGLHENNAGYQLLGSTVRTRAAANGVW